MTNWKSPSEYTGDPELVLVLCKVVEPPRSCDLPVSTGDHGYGEKFVSMGMRDFDGEWLVAGWTMEQDCWTNARNFEVLGWTPLPNAEDD